MLFRFERYRLLVIRERERGSPKKWCPHAIAIRRKGRMNYSGGMVIAINVMWQPMLMHRNGFPIGLSTTATCLAIS